MAYPRWHTLAFAKQGAADDAYKAECLDCPECSDCTITSGNYTQTCAAPLEHTVAEEPGVTLETLKIEPGYWRTSNESDNILACYNAVACVGGGAGAETLCAPGYKGPCEAGFKSHALSRRLLLPFATRLYSFDVLIFTFVAIKCVFACLFLGRLRCVRNRLRSIARSHLYEVLEVETPGGHGRRRHRRNCYNFCSYSWCPVHDIDGAC